MWWSCDLKGGPWSDEDDQGENHWWRDWSGSGLPHWTTSTCCASVQGERERERERERLNNLYLSPPSVLPENYIWWSRVLPHSPLDQLQLLQSPQILEQVPIPTSITNLRPLGMHSDRPLIHVSFQLISDSPFQINIHLNRGERRTKGTKLYNSFSGWTFLESHISDLAVITTWHIASLVYHIYISGIFSLSIQAMKMNYFCWYKLVPVW